MKALMFRYSVPKLAAGRILGAVSPRGLFGPWSSLQLEDVPEPELPADDWLRLRTVLCGICGSDSKQVFLRGDRDNPLTALVSFPHVLGHEAVGVVEDVGSAVRSRKPGDRIVVNPWLSCAPRGIDPVCGACARGDYPLCENFTAGRLPASIHLGNCSDVPGGFAEQMVIHESQAIPIPDGVDWETAALADPFSVSLHSILLCPPADERPAVVVGCGTLGLFTIAILRALFPNVPAYAVARYPHQAGLARQFGAMDILPEGKRDMVEAVAKLVGNEPLRPWQGEPWLLRGPGTVYDTVGSPGSVEQALRIADRRANVVVTGVEAPRRFEWTPLYFKEVSIVGSNAFGVETFEGKRLHSMEVYFELLKGAWISRLRLRTASRSIDTKKRSSPSMKRATARPSRPCSRSANRSSAPRTPACASP
jgi:threonine dehydrogenase-like Zn-dependent dehydrogenase